MKYLLSLAATLAMMTSSALADGHKYACPMHKEIIRDEPGQCPICGMDLVPVPAKPDEDPEDDFS
ncbi:MAG: heavy metal-binding domain-containing protein [Pseudomonadota bacterium]